MKPATRLVLVLLVLIAALHVVRLILQLPVTVGGTSIPVWFSGFGMVVFAALAIALWREHR
jgi:hypothetical protein